MMKIVLLPILSLFIYATHAEVNKILDQQPQQVHIAFGENTNEIVVTWSTMDETPDSLVEYGETDLNNTVRGTSTKFVDGGEAKHSQYIHKVTIKALKFNTQYFYHCGGSEGWSAEYRFKTPPAGSDWSPTLAIFGDMGNENAQSLAYLQQDAQRDMYNAILHVGDFAYDMDSEESLVGDQFMRQIETVAAYVPYMVCTGNHEEKYNFSNYRVRFSMPGNTESLMYSFDLGPVHFIAFNTEAYYFLNYGIKSLVNQYEWLEQDLAEANRPENRQQRPWIVTFGHRPMYCSNVGNNDCKEHETILRVGLPLTHFFGLEKLFYDNGVDVEIWAHEHSYERFWPLYDYKVYNGSIDEPYRNPGAPVHIITGSAGCKEEHTPFEHDIPSWSAYHSDDYGYTRMQAANKTHIHFEQVSVEQKGIIVDSFWIQKDMHNVYGRN